METKAKKKWKTPHTFVILVVIILIAAAATYIVPAGEFTRFKDAATGKTLVEAGSYHRIASNPLNPLLIPSAIYTGIVKSASTITFMLIIGGAFEVITSTGALTALCKKLSKTFSKHKYAVIPVYFYVSVKKMQCKAPAPRKKAPVTGQRLFDFGNTQCSFS